MQETCNPTCRNREMTCDHGIARHPKSNYVILSQDKLRSFDSKLDATDSTFENSDSSNDVRMIVTLGTLP